jgi:hypothetical protein
LRGDQWDRIKHFLPGREGHVWDTAADNRLFVDMLTIGCYGGPIRPQYTTAWSGASRDENMNS